MRLSYFLTSVILICVILTSFEAVAAQSLDEDWTRPQLIATTHGNLANSNLALVADRAGQLHLFYPHHPEENLPISVDYAQWDGVRWSDPIDILVQPTGALSFIQVAVDEQDTVHMIWQGDSNKLQYSRAPLSLAAQPQQWSEPVAIADVFGESDLVIGPSGILYVAYSDAVSGAAVLVTRSVDGGNVWMEPLLVSNSIPGQSPDEPQLAVDHTGRVHIAWTEYKYPEGWPPVATYYSHSNDGGEKWSDPLRISEGEYGQIGVSTVGDEEVHLVWRSTIGGDGTFHRWSIDGGLSWLETDQFADSGGFSGVPSFVTDSLGRLHYVIGPAKATTWENEQLDPYVLVYGDLPQIEELHQEINEQIGREWVQIEHPEQAKIAITQGNQLHVVFETGFNTLWHTSRMLGVAPIPPMTLSIDAAAIPTPVATITPIVAQARDDEPTPVVTQTYKKEMETVPTGPGTIVLLGIVPVGLLLAGLMTVRILFSRHN